MYTIEEFDKAKTKILKYIIYKKSILPSPGQRRVVSG